MTRQGKAGFFLSRCAPERNVRGSTASELPICLMIAILMFALPFIDLVFLSLRFALATAATSAAARAATAAPSFIANQQQSLSATNASKAVIDTYLSKFSGIELVHLSTVVQGFPINPAMASTPEYQGALKPDNLTDEYIYQYKVRAQMSIAPLICFNGVIFGPIEGLTKPMLVNCVCQRVCEKPETLVK